MPHPEAIRAQTTPEDGALFSVGLKNSKWVPEPHIAFTEDLRQINRTDLGEVRLGTQLIIPIEKTCTLIEDVHFRFTPPALTPAGGATYTRFVDFLALALITRIRWSYGSNTLQEYSMLHQFQEYEEFSDEKRANYEYLTGGGLTAAARNTYAVDPYELTVKIPTPWIDKRCHSPCISALANKLTLTIDFAFPAAVVQTDGTKPASLSLAGCALDYQQIHFTGSTRQELTAITNGKNGISYLYDDVGNMSFQVAQNYFRNTGNEFVQELRDIDGPISKMMITIRTQDSLDPTSTDPAPYEIDSTFLDGLSYRIVSNNMDLQDPESQLIDQVVKIDKFIECRYDTQHVLILWAEFPKIKNCASGNLTFGNFTNPKLLLKNPSLNANHPALDVSISYYRHNWLVHQRGVIQKVWR